jgi:predicted Fe-Mo cluster-binding NifX family protein
MKIGIAATGETLEAAVSERFGRCPFFIVIEQGASGFEAFANPAAEMPGGAGPRAVQELAGRGVQVAIAGEFGPRAQEALEAAGIRGITFEGGVRDAAAVVKE